MKKIKSLERKEERDKKRNEIMKELKRKKDKGKERKEKKT